MNEKDVIQHFISQQQFSSVAQGIGDDCAVLNISPNHQLVTTIDTMVEGRHFVKQSPPFELGYKLVASSLSDIASMGANPKWATLSITLTEFNSLWLSKFAKGLLECAHKHNVALVGGDTTLGKQLTMSLQVMGEVPIAKANMRNKAQAGDIIFVSGVIGCAAHALKYLQDNDYQHSVLSQKQISALYIPPSRIDMAIELRDLIHSCIDISDGLLHELEILCQQSHVGAELNLEKILIEQDTDTLYAITAGDDYELLFTAQPQSQQNIAQIASKYQCPLTAIGIITDSHQIELLKDNEHISYPDTSGFDHFQSVS